MNTDVEPDPTSPILKSFYNRKPQGEPFVARRSMAEGAENTPPDSIGEEAASNEDPEVLDRVGTVTYLPPEPIQSPRRIGFWIPFLATLSLLGLFGFGAYSAYQYGFDAGRSSESTKKRDPLGASKAPQPDPATMNELFINLRDGQAAAALTTLTALREKFPKTPSLRYLTLLAALQAGEIETAQAAAAESLAAGERVSDTLALQAMIELRKGGSGFGDPNIRAEELLKRAVAADPVNPLPYFELGSLYRRTGQRDLAIAFFESGRNRLTAKDSHVVADVILSLLKLEQTPDADLPAVNGESYDPRELIPAAYVAMRKEDWASAKDLLNKARPLLPPALFRSLMNDAAIRKMTTRGEMGEFAN